MATRAFPLSVGFARTRREPGDRRDFLPDLVRSAAASGAEVMIERGLGTGLGLGPGDYAHRGTPIRTGTRREVFARDLVVSLKAPDADLSSMRPGATLVSMLHFPTRPGRVARLRSLGLEAVSMDGICDDEGERLVEAMALVAWSGLDAAFAALERRWPGLGRPRRRPIRVAVMGAGMVGRHAVEAATKYGSRERNERISALGVPGVEVTTTGRNLTGHAPYVRSLLRRTDVLVDATLRDDPASPLVPNAWLGLLPRHAVICDLVADPYLDGPVRVVRAIEGIPRGDLARWEFDPGDPAWDELPDGIDTRQRRTVVSCGSWPGLRPVECMERYGRQLEPLLRTLIRRGGASGLRPDGGETERALYRASLRTWGARVPDAVPEAWRVTSGPLRALATRRARDAY